MVFSAKKHYRRTGHERRLSLAGSSSPPALRSRALNAPLSEATPAAAARGMRAGGEARLGRRRGGAGGDPGLCTPGRLDRPQRPRGRPLRSDRARSGRTRRRHTHIPSPASTLRAAVPASAHGPAGKAELAAPGFWLAAPASLSRSRR